MLLGVFIGTGEDHIGLGLTGVGDEDLGAVQHPGVAILDGRGLGAAGVGTGRWFGETEGPHLFTAGKRRQELLFLFLAAEEINGVGAKRKVGGESDTS